MVTVYNFVFGILFQGELELYMIFLEVALNLLSDLENYNEGTQSLKLLLFYKNDSLTL